MCRDARSVRPLCQSVTSPRRDARSVRPLCQSVTSPRRDARSVRPLCQSETSPRRDARSVRPSPLKATSSKLFYNGRTDRASLQGDVGDNRASLQLATRPVRPDSGRLSL